jgi:hypothetical protein
MNAIKDSMTVAGHWRLPALDQNGVKGIEMDSLRSM